MAVAHRRPGVHFAARNRSGANKYRRFRQLSEVWPPLSARPLDAFGLRAIRPRLPGSINMARTVFGSGPVFGRLATMTAPSRTEQRAQNSLLDFLQSGQPFDIATCVYYTGIEPFTGTEAYVAKGLRDRKRQRALMQFFKPENWFTVREALIQAGRQDLIGNGCDCLIPV